MRNLVLILICALAPPAMAQPSNLRLPDESAGIRWPARQGEDKTWLRWGTMQEKSLRARDWVLRGAGEINDTRHADNSQR